MGARGSRGAHLPRDVVLRREMALDNLKAQKNIAVPAPVAASVPHANAAFVEGARAGCVAECLENTP